MYRFCLVFTQAFILLMFTLGKQSVFHFIVISSVCVSLTIHKSSMCAIFSIGSASNYSITAAIQFFIITSTVYIWLGNFVFFERRDGTEKNLSGKISRKTDFKWYGGASAWRYFVSNFYSRGSCYCEDDGKNSPC